MGETPFAGEGLSAPVAPDFGISCRHDVDAGRLSQKAHAEPNHRQGLASSCINDQVDLLAVLPGSKRAITSGSGMPPISCHPQSPDVHWNEQILSVCRGFASRTRRSRIFGKKAACKYGESSPVSHTLG